LESQVYSMSRVCGNYIEMNLSETQVTLCEILIKLKFVNLGLIATLFSLIIGVDIELRVKHGSCIGQFNFVTKHLVHPSVHDVLFISEYKPHSIHTERIVYYLSNERK
jgi:hypothetical protein